MKREQRHMPCQFKVDRIRASYTRIHKALAWMLDNERNLQARGIGLLHSDTGKYVHGVVIQDKRIRSTPDELHEVTITKGKKVVMSEQASSVVQALAKMLERSIRDECQALADAWGMETEANLEQHKDESGN